MKVIICKNYKEMSKRAARIVADLVKKKPDCVLGVCTGSTPIKMYKMLVRIAKKEKIDFSNVKAFNVDDYLGLSPNDRGSHTYYMNKRFFSKVNIKKKNTFMPGKNIKNFSKLIKKAGGIDLQLLGIGVNGHIGYNEPGSKLSSPDRKIKLTENTRRVNLKWFPSLRKEPKYAATMGISSILKTKKIILLANGYKKADAISKAVEGTITSNIPASFLRKHKNCMFIIDKKAASKLSKKYNK